MNHPKPKRPNLGHVEPWLRDLVARQRGRVAIDVGANVGAFAANFSPRFAHVVALEPNPEAFQLLAERAPANVLAIPIAAGERNGLIKLWRYRDNASTGDRTSRSESLKNGQAVEPGQRPFVARCARLDALPIEGVDLIKIDVEGAELDVLRGASSTWRRWRPRLLIEIHAAHLAAMIAAELAELYHLRRIEHANHVRRGDQAAAANHFHLFATPK